MPKILNKIEKKIYFKRLREDIYQKEFNKAKAELMKKERTKRIKEIQSKARRDAELSMLSGKQKIMGGLKRIQSGAEKIQRKRVEISKKIGPYYENWQNNLNKQFNLKK